MLPFQLHAIDARQPHDSCAIVAPELAARENFGSNLWYANQRVLRLMVLMEVLRTVKRLRERENVGLYETRGNVLKIPGERKMVCCFVWHEHFI